MTKHNFVAGRAYKTSGKCKCFYIGENPLNQDRPLLFVHENGDLFEANYMGVCISIDRSHEYDIIGEWPPEPKKWQCWANVHRTYDGNAPLKFAVCKDREHADNQADVKQRIACIPIEFIEGEGL